MRFRLLHAARIGLGVFLGFSVGVAQGAPITWNYKALLTDITPGGGDPLKIDGEILELQITYDDINTWALGTDNRLYFPSAYATATITGSHDVTLQSPLPAAAYGSGPNPASVGQELYVSNFVDFMIDGVGTRTRGFQGRASVAPSEGVRLGAAHLLNPSTLPIRTDMTDGVTISDCNEAGVSFICNYNLKTVPVLPAVWLFGSGLLGLIGLASRGVGFTRWST
ncbi:MAG: hypothetical protein ACWGNB_03885 [Thiogranum sp.]